MANQSPASSSRYLTPVESGPAVLEVRGITKRFPGVVANENVNLRLQRGEILALLGENGAGKSTLMNIIYGLYHPTEGEILVNGKPVVMHSPLDAISLGIGMVHQHFQLVPVMTVAENIMLGSETIKRGFLDRDCRSLRAGCGPRVGHRRSARRGAPTGRDRQIALSQRRYFDSR
jgi:ABC-type sugar transport system ATPase subunit